MDIKERNQCREDFFYQLKGKLNSWWLNESEEEVYARLLDAIDEVIDYYNTHR